MKRIIITTSIIIFCTVSLFACSCGELDLINKKDYDKAGEIFVGRVIKIIENKDEWEKYITFEIIEKIKSTEFKGELTIHTALDEAACGLSTEIGEKWYIFSFRNDEGELRTGLCGRSVQLDKKFKISDYGVKYAYLEKKAWKKNVKRYRQEKKFIEKIEKNAR